MSSFVQAKAAADNAFKAGNFEEAVHDYTTCIEIEPLHAIAYCNRSASFFKLKKYQESLRDAKKSCEIDPKYVKAWYRLACAAIEVKDFSTASLGLSKAQKLQPCLDYFIQAQIILKHLAETKTIDVDMPTFLVVCYALDSRQHPSHSLRSEEEAHALKAVCEPFRISSFSPQEVQELVDEYQLFDVMLAIKKKSPTHGMLIDAAFSLIITNNEQFVPKLVQTNYIESCISTIRVFANPFKFVEEGADCCSQHINQSLEALRGLCSYNEESDQILGHQIRKRVVALGIIPLVETLYHTSSPFVLGQTDYAKLYDPDYKFGTMIIKERYLVNEMLNTAYLLLGALLLTPELRSLVLDKPNVRILSPLPSMVSICTSLFALAAGIGHTNDETDLQRTLLHQLVQEMAALHRVSPDMMREARKEYTEFPVEKSFVRRMSQIQIVDVALRIDAGGLLATGLGRTLSNSQQPCLATIALYCKLFEHFMSIVPKQLSKDQYPFLEIPGRTVRCVVVMLLRFLQSDVRCKDNLKMHFFFFSMLRNMARSPTFMTRYSQILHESKIGGSSSSSSSPGTSSLVSLSEEPYQFLQVLDVDSPQGMIQMHEHVLRNMTTKKYILDQDKQFEADMRSDPDEFINLRGGQLLPYKEWPDTDTDNADLLNLLSFILKTIRKFGTQENGKICVPIADTLRAFTRCSTHTSKAGAVIDAVIHSGCIDALVDAVGSITAAPSFVKFSAKPEGKLIKFICQVVQRVDVCHPMSRATLGSTGAIQYLQSMQSEIPSTCVKLVDMTKKALEKVEK